MKDKKNKGINELDLLLDDDKRKDVFTDEKHLESKGNFDKDFRLNPNNNDREIDVVCKKNQLK